MLFQTFIFLLSPFFLFGHMSEMNCKRYGIKDLVVNAKNVTVNDGKMEKGFISRKKMFKVVSCKIYLKGCFAEINNIKDCF